MKHFQILEHMFELFRYIINEMCGGGLKCGLKFCIRIINEKNNCKTKNWSSKDSNELSNTTKFAELPD